MSTQGLHHHFMFSARSQQADNSLSAASCTQKAYSMVHLSALPSGKSGQLQSLTVQAPPFYLPALLHTQVWKSWAFSGHGYIGIKHITFICLALYLGIHFFVISTEALINTLFLRTSQRSLLPQQKPPALIL